jgi:tetratricopeptide (TPR) repeat protein
MLLRTRGEPIPRPTPSKATPTETDLSWLATTVEEKERAIHLYNEAVEQFEEDNPQEKKAAELKIREAASMDPDFAEPLRFLGRLAMQRQNWAEASRYSEALIRIDPKDEEAIRDLYVSLVIMRHFKRVGEAAKLLIAFDQENISHVERHAQEFFKNDQIVMARALYEALSEIAPDPINAYLNLGICCTSLGDVEGTRAAFEAFIEIAPEDHPDLESVRRDLAGLDAPVAPEAQGAPEAPE